MLTENEVVLRNLSVADLLVQGVFAIVDVGEDTQRVESLGDLRGICVLNRIQL